MCELKKKEFDSAESSDLLLLLLPEKTKKNETHHHRSSRIPDSNLSKCETEVGEEFLVVLGAVNHRFDL